MSQQINFNINGEPMITIDEQGFHYRTRFIEDAGEAHKLFISVMKLLKHQNKVIEDKPEPVPPPAPAPEVAPVKQPRAKKPVAKADAATPKKTAKVETSPAPEKKPRTSRKKTDIPAD